MTEYEKLGLFYLGRPYDLAARKPAEADGLVLYDSRDLVTHAVCVGMTGSGKTGLCLGLIEEAALDAIPVIAIDPKGDLGNLLLTFPDLAPGDFLPWVSEEDAARRGMAKEAFAAEQAERWRAGLAEWGQSGDRIRRLRAAAEMTIYTPGSRAGVPVSILDSFAAPAAALRDDQEIMAERADTAATSLLALAGVTAEPVRSREHVLLATIFTTAWRHGRSFDLAGIIQQIQKPPVATVGVLDLESFYPERDRFDLAMRINQLLAAPGFETWLEGAPLDVGRLLYSDTGRPRVSIFSIAHLDDAERMFFVSLLLNQVLGWARTQPGTTSLRAIVYMDEIFGFFPPVENPPSKKPLLTLLKQSRAFGLGIVLATQNPVDLDYKGLANAGTWFIGRLQTERDKARVLDGLEGVSGSRGLDRAALDGTLGALGSRVFLMHNVHEDRPIVFETRWAMSYLRGPLTRDEIKRLMADRRPAAAARPATPAGTGSPEGPRHEGRGEGSPASVTGVGSAARSTGEGPVAVLAGTGRPVMPSGIAAYFVRPREGTSGRIRYGPALFAAARLRFADSKRGVDETQEVAFVVPITTGPIPVAWDGAREVDLKPTDLADEPAGDAEFEPLPPEATRAKSYDRWRTEFSRWLAETQRFELLYSRRLALVSKPHEAERDFRVRLQTAAHEERDRAVDRLRQKYAPRVAGLQEKVRRAELAVARESGQAQQQKVQTAVSFGATVLGALFGRKTITAGTLGRATTAARGVGRAAKEAQDVRRAEETVQAARAQLADLEARIRAEADAVAATVDPSADALETLTVRPKKTDITVQLVALVWTQTSRVES
jgi:hypothetical protein